VLPGKKLMIKYHNTLVTMQASKGKISKTTGFDEDMDTLESMDFEKLTDTIRDNCKTRIKELDLGHLIKP
jgi:hypothetical protein